MDAVNQKITVSILMLYFIIITVIIIIFFYQSKNYTPLFKGISLGSNSLLKKKHFQGLTE